MNKLPNIAFVGKARSGKDTAYSFLEELGYKVQRVAFGDYMKSKFHEVFPWIPPHPKPVDEYQKFNMLTQIDDQVWVKPTMGDVYRDIEMRSMYDIEPTAYIFTDIRQAHEYEAVKKLGCVFVKIEVPQEVRIERAKKLGEVFTEEMLNRPTELAMDSFEYDYTIRNSGDLESFKVQLFTLIDHLEEVHNDMMEGV